MTELKEEIKRAFINDVCKVSDDVKFAEFKRIAEHFAEWQRNQRYIENAQKYDQPYPNDVVTKIFGAGNLESWEYDEAEKVFGYACEVVEQHMGGLLTDVLLRIRGEISSRIKVMQKHHAEYHKVICHLDSILSYVESLQKEAIMSQYIDGVKGKYVTTTK